MSEEIQSGDVVRLKSGGPAMTVSKVGQSAAGDTTAWCEWFDDKNAAQKKAFNINTVEKEG